jgi:hypothetical protein
MSQALKNIEQFRRDTLLDLVNQCTEKQQLMFKRCFSHTDLEKPIDKIVADMPVGKLDSAITLCERTIIENSQR